MPVLRAAASAVMLFASLAFAEVAPDSPRNIGAEDLEYLRAVMKETWHYLDWHVSLVTGLPYDSSEGKDITNTTNIGLYLAALCMATKLGYVTEEYALARATRILDSLDTYEHWHRLYNNWVDPEGKYRGLKPGDNNISDYNKLPAGHHLRPPDLPAARRPLHRVPRRDPVGEVLRCRQRQDVLCVRRRGEADEVPGAFLPRRGQDPRAIPDDRVRQGAGLDVGHARRLRRKRSTASATSSTAGRAADIFMQLICGLFLDNRGTALGHSAANFAWAQTRPRPPDRRAGLGLVGLRRRRTARTSAWAPSSTRWSRRTRAPSPPASSPRAVIENLRRLETYGLRRPVLVQGKPESFGFRDAVNWRTGEITDKYLTLDQAMLFLALVNLAEDGLLWKTFAADPLVSVRHRARSRNTAAPRCASRTNSSMPRDFRSASRDRSGCGPTARPSIARATWSGRTLWGRSLSHVPMADVSVQWRLADAKGATRHQRPRRVRARAVRNPAGRRPHLHDGAGTVRLDVAARKPDVPRRNRGREQHRGRFGSPATCDLAGTWKLKTGDDMAWAGPTVDDSDLAQGQGALEVGRRRAPRVRRNGLVSSALLACLLKYRNHWGNAPLAIALGARGRRGRDVPQRREDRPTGAFPPEEEDGLQRASRLRLRQQAAHGRPTFLPSASATGRATAESGAGLSRSGRRRNCAR